MDKNSAIQILDGFESDSVDTYFLLGNLPETLLVPYKGLFMSNNLVKHPEFSVQINRNFCWTSLENFYISGEMPEFLVIPYQKEYCDIEVLVCGTDLEKINKYRDTYYWYDLTQTIEGHIELAKNIDYYYEKSQSIQWYDSLLERLEKNYIDADSKDDNDKLYLTFRDHPASLEQLGIIAIEEIPISNPRYTGTTIKVTDGKDWVEWYHDHWDNHWKLMAETSSNK